MAQAAIAARLAARAHDGAVDKAGLPYLAHPAAVAALVATAPGYGDLDDLGRDRAQAAAWLHDVVEDTDLGVADLAAGGIDPVVLAAVEALTHRRHEPRPEYYARVVADPLARLVKAADIAHNASRGRLAALDEATAARLSAKYAAAADAVLSGSAERAWFAAATR